MIINDLWGQIRIEPKYEKVINSKEFNDLKNKNQLGLNTNPNAIHTRYSHSIGVYYLAGKLIEICNKKFKDLVKITKEDEEAVKCMALVHDIGHGPFSHVSEKFFNESHEEKSIAILLDKNSEVHNAIIEEFGENVLQKVIDLIKMKKKIQDNQNNSDEIDLLFIVSKLLSGGIDIDRIDYIFRDSKHALCEDNNFSSILESIGLEYIDDSLEIVFDSLSEYTISNFFNKRFELYDTLYLNNETKIIESVFERFLKKMQIKLNWRTSEIELYNLFMNSIKSNDECISRYAKLLLSKTLTPDFKVKEINNKEEFEYFLKRINSIIPSEKYGDCMFSSYAKASTYNLSNKIFIKTDGLIKDISETSKILNSNLSKEKYLFSIDFHLLQILFQKNNVDSKTQTKIIKEILNLFSPEIEQEKKYIFGDDVIDKKEEFKKIKNAFGLENPEYIENDDTYYDENDILEKRRIAVRKRITNGNGKWYVKRPLNDKSSITKREEKIFSSKEEVIEFIAKEYKIYLKNLTEKIRLKTLRAMYILNYNGGIFEFAFDKTEPIINGQIGEPNYMIECELKSGNSSGLYFIDKKMKQLKSVKECELSKKEYALNYRMNKFDFNSHKLNANLNIADYIGRFEFIPGVGVQYIKGKNQ